MKMLHANRNTVVDVDVTTNNFTVYKLTFSQFDSEAAVQTSALTQSAVRSDGSIYKAVLHRPGLSQLIAMQQHCCTFLHDS